MTKDTISLQKFLIPFDGHMYARLYVKSEKEGRTFRIESTIGPDSISKNPIIKIRYKNSEDLDFLKYSPAMEHGFEKIHAHNRSDIYEFDSNRIDFPVHSNGSSISSISSPYNNLSIDTLYKKKRTLEDYTEKSIRKMFKDRVKISIGNNHD